MFYVFVTINCIGNIIEFIYKAKNPWGFWTDGDDDIVLKISEQFEVYSETLIGICLIITMW